MAATTELPGKQKNKSRIEKKAQTTQSSANAKLKTVVRRLPPNLPEEVFWQSVQAWVTEETVSWRAFYPGKIRKKHNISKENLPSRAYIAFRTMEQLGAFGQAYDGHVFRDKAGNEYTAVVEFAPLQKIPSEKRKADTRMGTIEQDEDYKSFLAALNAPASKPSETETIEALVAASQPPEQPKTTPLLEALRAEKQAQRDKEIILKAHAHYRAKEDLTGRKKGKQSQGVLPSDRDEVLLVSGQGKRNRRGGKKGEAITGSLAGQKARDKEARPSSPAKVISRASAKPKPQQTHTATVKDGSKEPAQEGRPRLGIGSRQFAAALAGAGVLPAGSGADRKSRRERERDRKVNESAITEDSQKEGDKDKEKPEKPQMPASPGKERSRGGRKRGDCAKSQVLPTPNAVDSISGSIPTILPRGGNQPGILLRPGPVAPVEGSSSDLVAGEPGAKQNAGGQKLSGEGRVEDRGRGGRRRGRGRGAGRGGGPVPGGT